MPQNYVEAARWYRKGSDQGNADAQAALGMLCFLGKGVPRDIVFAHMWLNLAASRSPVGFQKGASELGDQVAAAMTPAQIAEAQRLAREWKPTATK